MNQCINEISRRGFLHQCTNLDDLSNAMQKPITFYIGFDCTASSLHVGSLMPIMLVRLLQQQGHKPIIIVGGATTKIGDPTGKDSMRKMLTQDQINENIKGITKSLSKFIKFGSDENDAILLNNDDWLDKVKYLEFLRDFGSKISVNRMLTMESVKLRIEREQPLTFLEFNYMLLQSYDFYYLNKHHNCILQLGGSDQWGNIVSSIDMVKKMNNQESFGLTTPLLTTSSGAKMGKSVGGAIWLNEDLLSPYDYFQYWRNIQDEDVIRFANIFCEFDQNKIDTLKDLCKSNINDVKKEIAYEITKLCHGKENADNALSASVKLFENKELDENLPSIQIKKEIIESGIPCYELFNLAKLTQSKGDARRLIRNNGAKINDIKINEENMIIDNTHIINGVIKLSSGKKTHIIIKLN